MHVYPQCVLIVVLNLSFYFHRMWILVFVVLLYSEDFIVQRVCMNSTVDELKKLVCGRFQSIVY